MQRALRLTGSKRFSLIHREAQSRANRLLVLKAMSNDLDGSRFGILVGKRIGNAVSRNRVRRRLREVTRLTPVKAGWDIVFIARRGAADADYHQLQCATHDLLKRAGLLSSPTNPVPADTSARGWPRLLSGNAEQDKAKRGLALGSIGGEGKR